MYEPGREEYVTLIANYVPVQAAYGGPNYFPLDSEALYEIHIDNDGDSVEDLTFQFDFSDSFPNGETIKLNAFASPRAVAAKSCFNFSSGVAIINSSFSSHARCVGSRGYTDSNNIYAAGPILDSLFSRKNISLFVMKPIGTSRRISAENPINHLPKEYP